MSSQEFTDNHAPPGTPVRAGSPLGVAMIGYAFMGRARSNAWRNVHRDDAAPVREQGFRRILDNEPEHPRLAAWWPQGHVIGWEHTFTHGIRDFLAAIGHGTPPSSSFGHGLAAQRVLAAVEESANANSSIIQLASGPATVSPTEGA